MGGCLVYVLSKSGRLLEYWRGWDTLIPFSGESGGGGGLEGIELTNEEDSMRWALTPHDRFTTSSLYRHWSFPGVRDLMMDELWHSKLPLKIKNFVWLVHRNRV
jgi:hypothetical protein